MPWKVFIGNKKNRLELILTVAALAIILFSFSKFILFIENRSGVAFNDLILSLFTPVDLTWFTFALIYISIIIALIQFGKNPVKLVTALQCYGLMVIFRAIAMYLTPLEAPATLLPLNDPFIQLFGGGNILEKDLFFSGHTATLFLLFLLMEKRLLKLVFLIFTLLVGIAVILQHVHYSVDVFAAPFFAYASYRIVLSLRKEGSANGKQ